VRKAEQGIEDSVDGFYGRGAVVGSTCGVALLRLRVTDLIEPLARRGIRLSSGQV
jgi:hypothetical protein